MKIHLALPKRIDRGGDNLLKVRPRPLVRWCRPDMIRLHHSIGSLTASGLRAIAPLARAKLGG
ncbi:MAG: hypothetical protein EA001_07805 [Oscillatoriales cyanobacterium]|nr:MAG: hypothetical protein EA001_07805 [Oscillatoriales cyanobacterium]